MATEHKEQESLKLEFAECGCCEILEQIQHDLAQFEFELLERLDDGIELLKNIEKNTE